MSNKPLGLTRNQLAEFLPNQRAVRAFEQLLKSVGELLPSDVTTLNRLIQESSIDALTASAKADQANGLLQVLAGFLQVLATSPQHVPQLTVKDLEALSLQPPQRQPLVGELIDVSVTTPAAGNTLIYDATVRKWKNALLTAGANINITNADGSITIAVTGIGTASALASDTDGTLAANSDTRVATQKAVKTYVDAAVTGLLDFKGSTNCSANPNYPAALKGDAYVVSAAGKIGGASGLAVDIGDVFVASADNAGGTQASVGTSWFILEHNLAGALLSANNLSDLANAATARTNLGVAIGTNVQAWDADLDAIAAIASTVGLLKKTAANTWTLDTTAYESQANKGVASGYASLGADGFLPVAQSKLYYNTNTKSMQLSSGNVDWFLISLGSFQMRSMKISVVFGLSSGAAGARIFYRESLVIESGGATLNETNLRSTVGGNGSLSFVLAGSTLTVRTTSSIASAETARMSIMLEGYEMTSALVTVL